MPCPPERSPDFKNLANKSKPQTQLNQISVSYIISKHRTHLSMLGILQAFKQVLKSSSLGRWYAHKAIWDVVNITKLFLPKNGLCKGLKPVLDFTRQFCKLLVSVLRQWDSFTYRRLSRPWGDLTSEFRINTRSSSLSRRADEAAEAVWDLILVSDHVISWGDLWRALIHSQVTRHLRNTAV